MRRIFLFLAVLLIGAGSVGAEEVSAKIVGKTVEYSAQSTTMKGYLAYDNAVKGKRPGILVVHEWWGLNNYARKRADMLAHLGYTALAVDMYGGGKTATHPADAGKFSSELMKNFDVAKAAVSCGRRCLEKTTDSRTESDRAHRLLFRGRSCFEHGGSGG